MKLTFHSHQELLANLQAVFRRNKRSLGKQLLQMKLLAIFLTTACFQVSAHSSAQITIQVKDATLDKIFTEIERQTKYIVMFDWKDLEGTKKVNLNMINVTAVQILDKALFNQPLEYTVKEQTVFIFRKRSPNREFKNKEEIRETIEPVQITVRGKVINQDDEPVPGVSVQVKGGRTGASTDADGEFELNRVSPNSILILTSTTIQPIEVEVNNRIKLEIKVVGKAGILDEVKVIAYGKITQRVSPGNSTTIKSSDIEKQPVNNPLLALTGRAPGLVVNQYSGVPGASVSLRIQGQNSLLNGNDPFIVIDGIPFSSQMLPTYRTGFNDEILGANGNSVGSPLSLINPSDIESIEILKDADATAIYGSRAANGAIIITTKRGKSGPLSFKAGIQQGFGNIASKLDLLDTRSYIEMRREAIRNDNDTLKESRDYDIMGKYGWDTTRTKDWQKQLLGNTASYLNINANISGGTKKLSYLIGGNYQRETSVFPGKFANVKGGGMFNLNAQSENGKLNISISGSYTVDFNKLPRLDLTSVALTLPPTAPDEWLENGTLNWAINPFGNSSWQNPLNWTIRKFESKSSNFLTNVKLSYKIIPGLEGKINIGYNTLTTNSTMTNPLDANPPQERPFALRATDYSDNSVNTFIVEPQFNFKRNFSFGRIQIISGATYQENSGDGISYHGEGYSSDNLMKDKRSAASLAVLNSIIYKYKYNALFGRIDYSYFDKHIIGLSARRDGSSRFGSNNLFSNFYSIAYAYIFTKEKFIHNLLPALSFGKIKGSYGTTGSDQIGDYKYLSLYGPITFPGLTPYQNQVGLMPMGLPNIFLEWEETRKMSFGIELGAFEDRIFVTGNFSKNVSSNQLLTTALPSFTGFQDITTNLPAKIENRTWEFTLSSTNITSKSFSWKSNFNLTLPSNKLLRFENLENTGYSQFYEVGKSVNLIRLFELNGVNRQTGAYEFIDREGKITATPDPLLDRHIVRNLTPDFYGGLDNLFTYAGFEFSFFIHFSKQFRDRLDRGLGGGPAGIRRLNEPISVLDRWKAPGDVTKVQRFNSVFSPNGESLFDQFNNMMTSDKNYSSTFYARLKNVSLSYAFPGALLRLTHLKNGRVYLSAQNLATFSNYTGLDPETGNSSLPPIRMITMGIQLTF